MSKDYLKAPYFKRAEDLANMIAGKIHTDNVAFLRVSIAYQFAKIASNMRINIKTHDRGTIPVNMYAINLAPSGMGKGHSTNIIEDHLMKEFYENFLELVLPDVVEESIAKLAVDRAKKSQRAPEEEERAAKDEYNRAGAYAFSFDSATTPAVKQLRHKLLMAGAGALSMEIDEIGSNLLSNAEVLTAFLELYDIGKIKQKLTKNTSDSVRNEEIKGLTPTNLMLMGTPAKLLDGGKVEQELTSLFETGYGRRCIFSYTDKTNRKDNLTPEERYKQATSHKSHTDMAIYSQHLASLADPIYFGQELSMSKDLAIELVSYQMDCEKRAEALPDHEQIRKAEITHRYFKAVKMAGAYAFVDKSPTIEQHHLDGAIRVVEESGIAFENLLRRERNFIRLAKYILNVGHEITNVDLVEELPFFNGSVSKKQELMNLAVAWAYKQGGVIKRKFEDGIEFYSGEMLTRTNLNKMILSHSDDFAYNYKPALAPFGKLNRVFDKDGYQFCTHYFKDGHRNNENALDGFNLLVIDIDEGNTLEEARTFLKEFKYWIYTTKRHTDAKHRFRIVMPLSHELKLNESDYKQFMDNVLEFLPFNPDTSVNQRSRKWACYGNSEYKAEGKLFPVMPFIPKTSKSDQLKAKLKELGNLNALERWFINNTGDGNRNNQLFKYAAMLVDANKTYQEIEYAVKELNNKLPDKLDEAELTSTILITAAKEVAKRDK